MSPYESIEERGAPPRGERRGPITPEGGKPMRRKSVSTWLVLVLALTLLAAAGCGGDKSLSSSSQGVTAAAASVSADQVVKNSEAKMAQLKSASFTADMGLEVQGDPNKMTDPTQKAMLSQGISLHVEGKSTTAPMASDMKMNVGIAGQTLDFGMMAQGDKAVSYTHL